MLITVNLYVMDFFSEEKYMEMELFFKKMEKNYLKENLKMEE